MNKMFLNPHSNKNEVDASDKASAQCKVENQDFLKAVKVQCRKCGQNVVMLH